MTATSMLQETYLKKALRCLHLKPCKAITKVPWVARDLKPVERMSDAESSDDVQFSMKQETPTS